MGLVNETEYTAEQQIIYVSQVVLLDHQDNSSTFQKKQKINTTVKVYLQKGCETLPYPGEQVIVEGTFQPFASATNPGQFDQKKYQASLGIGFALFDGGVKYHTKERDEYTTWLLSFRERWSEVYSTYLKENSGVLQAMILGKRKEMDTGVKELYRRNGLAHLLSISALHISFVGMSLFVLLQKCRIPLWINVPLSLFLIFSYGKMTDASSATMRAILMFSLFLLAKIRHRTYDLLTGVAFAFFLLLLENPRVLYNTGFQMSFFAVLGIGITNPKLQELFPGKYHKRPKERAKMPAYLWEKYVKKPFLASLGINSFLLPILLFSYYEFPMYSLILNLLVIPLMSLVLAFGIVGGLVGLVIPTVAAICLFPADLILNFYETLCLLAEKLPFAVWIVGKPEPWQIGGYYLVLLLVLFGGKVIAGGPCKGENPNRRGRKARLTFVTVSVGLLMILMLPGQLRRIGRDRVTMLDVGQGDCFCIETAGKVLLIDGGSSSESEIGKYRIEPFLKSQGIHKVDYVFISHSDSDHCNGIEEILTNSPGSKIRYENLVLTSYARENQEDYAGLLEAAAVSDSKISYVSAGMELILKEKRNQENIKITCLHPSKGETFSDANDSSMVLLFTCQGKRMLFTGDLSSSQEESLPELDVDILKVAHHGSKTGSGEAFLAKTKPELGLISCGQDNSYGHPHKELLKRLKKQGVTWSRTDECGAVMVWMDEGKIRVKSEVNLFK